MDPGWVLAAVSIATVLTGLLAWLARWAWRLGRRTWQFMSDWEGEPVTPGHEHRPGVMERLQKLEITTMDISAQVHLNSGHSLRDTVQRTEDAVAGLRRSVDELSARIRGGQP